MQGHIVEFIVFIIILLLMLTSGSLNAVSASKINSMKTSTDVPELDKAYSFAVGAASLDFIAFALLLIVFIVIMVRGKQVARVASNYILLILLFFGMFFLIISAILSSIAATLVITSTSTSPDKTLAYQNAIGAASVAVIGIVGLIISFFFFGRTSNSEKSNSSKNTLENLTGVLQSLKRR